MPNRFYVISLGCPKNIVDSDNLIRGLISSGFYYSMNFDEAEIILVNTCGFIQEAKKESIEEILKIVQQKGSKTLIVFGCLAKRYREDLVKEIPEIDAIFGIGEDKKIIEYLNSLQKNIATNASKKPSDYRLPTFPYAYLKIAEGCNRKCGYCAIPSIKGRYKSTKPEIIISEAERLINNGIKELVLVAQDTTCYGTDLNKFNIADLLKDLCSINGDFWIRLLYAYPSSIKESLLKTIAEQNKICKYLDIPLQHTEDRILKLMKRSGSRKSYLALIKKIRKIIPDVALRTTLIVGYPTETGEEFNRMVDFIEEVRFDRLGVFRYSKEEGTPASELKGHLPEKIKHQRFDKLMRHQASISLEKNKTLIGKEFRVLIDEIKEGIAIARTYSHAPEIDGVVIIEQESSGQGIKWSSGKTSSALKPQNTSHLRRLAETRTLESSSVRAGDFTYVRITEAFEYDLKGIIIR